MISAGTAKCMSQANNDIICKAQKIIEEKLLAKQDNKKEKHIAKLLLKADKAITMAIDKGKFHAYFGLGWSADEKYLCSKALRNLGYTVDTDMYCRVRADWW